MGAQPGPDCVYNPPERAESLVVKSRKGDVCRNVADLAVSDEANVEYRMRENAYGGLG